MRMNTSASEPTVAEAEPVGTAVAASLLGRRRRHWQRNCWLVAGLLLVWLGVTFGVSYYARALNFRFFGWPFSFWMAAQGALLVYLLLVVSYALLMNRLDQHYELDEED